MAKILFSGTGIVAARGKINGTVLSANKYGPYQRTKVTPVNPRTSAQSLVRARLTGLSQGWRNLTQVQRDAWNSAAPNFPIVDVFGNTKTLSGNSLYCRLNLNLQNAGQAVISDPPTPGAVTAVSALSATMTTGTPALSIVFAPTPVPTGFTLVIEATQGVSAGKSNLDPLYRKITTVAAAGTSPNNALTAYTTKFGSVPAIGQKVGFRAFFVNNLTGQTGQPLKAYVTIAS